MLSSLIKHSCTFTQNTTSYPAFKNFFSHHLQWMILTLRHDPKDLPFVDSSPPYSTVTDSVQTRKLTNKKPAASD